MPYQTFEIGAGDSDSHKKMAALGLDKDIIKDKKCIDIGCNEGYFCFELANLGANKVLGIDVSTFWIDQAKKRLDTMSSDIVQFQVCDWQNITNTLTEKFDIVLLLSSFHYATSPEWFNEDGTNKLLNNIKQLMKKNSIFIWEGGVIGSDSLEWVRVRRAIDSVYHPTRGSLELLFSQTFKSFKYIGLSVNQRGDPIPRYVYHCYT